MSKKEQERLEDYLELEKYVEHLSLQRSAYPPANLPLEQIPIYSMAKFFHTASPRLAADPRPEFKAQLGRDLLQQMQMKGQPPLQPPTTTLTNSSQSQRQFRRIYSNKEGSQRVQTSLSMHAESAETKKHKLRDLWKGLTSVPRRTVLTGGSIAAALLAGAGIGTAIGYSVERPTLGRTATLPGDVWHPVTSLEQLGNEPMRFTTNSITGYVIRQIGNGNENATLDLVSSGNTSTEQIIAFSAACTHLGCIVQWQKNTEAFKCPCHGRTFDTEGGPTNTESHEGPYIPLPRLDTKIENGNIYVKVP